MNQTIRLLGLDPALRNTGMAVTDYNIGTGELTIVKLELAKTAKGSDAKVVRKSSDDLARGRVIIRELARVIAIHRPSIVVAEVPSGAQDARASFSNGVCCGVLASIGLPMIEVSPNEVKLAAVGTRTATKDQMIQWAVAKWPNAGWYTRKLKGELVLLNENEHMADACAVVSAGLLTVQFAQSIAMLGAMRAA